MEKIKLFCVSLGCDKNLVDTEKMLGVAGGLGVSFTDDETEADAILINTCCFIGDAKEESVNTILEMARYKEEGKCRALIVAGCLAQRYKQEMFDDSWWMPSWNYFLRRDQNKDPSVWEKRKKRTYFLLP